MVEGNTASRSARFTVRLSTASAKTVAVRVRVVATQGQRNLSPLVAGQLWQATAGNPLALLELPGILSEEQLEGRDPLEEPLPLGPSLEEAYRRRIGALPQATRSALTVAAASDTVAMREISLALKARADSRPGPSRQPSGRG